MGPSLCIANIESREAKIFSETGPRSRSGHRARLQAGRVVTKLLLRRSLLGEAKKWAQFALSKLSDRERGSSIELDLITAYGQALMVTDGTLPGSGVCSP